MNYRFSGRAPPFRCAEIDRIANIRVISLIRVGSRAIPVKLGWVGESGTALAGGGRFRIYNEKIYLQDSSGYRCCQEDFYLFLEK